VALLTTLLDRIGIRATPILVSATLRGAAAQLLPSPLAFDHTIVRVDLDAQSYYLDATRTEQTGTLANRETAGFGQGLPLTSQGSALAALPTAYGIAHLTVTDTFYFERMDADPTLESRFVFRGDLAEAMRSVIAKQGPEALFKQLAGSYLKLYPAAHTTAPMTVESSKDDDVLTLVNHFVVPGFFSPSDGIARTAQLVPFAVMDTLGFPATESRHTPLGFQFPGIVRHTDIVDFPEDVFPKKEAAQRFEGGDVHVSVRQVAEHTRHNVEIFTELSIDVDQIDPDDWPTFSKKIQELRPRLYRTVRIPAVTNLDAPEKPADTNNPTIARPTGAPESLLKSALSGIPQFLEHFHELNADCTSMGMETVIVTRAPSHGSVVIQNNVESYPNYPPANQRYECNKRRAPSVAIMYTSEKAFVGTDRFTVHRVSHSGNLRVYEYIVTVEQLHSTEVGAAKP